MVCLLETRVKENKSQSIIDRYFKGWKWIHNKKQFYMSVVYGFNEGSTKRSLWRKLCSLKGSISGKPWLLVGDYNIIAKPEKSSSYDGNPRINLDMREFKEWVQELEVVDHSYTGPVFTWSNHQKEGVLARKLDRVLINDKWMQVFVHSTVDFISP